MTKISSYLIYHSEWIKIRTSIVAAYKDMCVTNPVVISLKIDAFEKRCSFNESMHVDVF